MSLSSPAFVVGLIPSRWGSSRFPGKPLHLIAGKPLVQHVFDQVSRCSSLHAIAIATDDDRIAQTARAFGASAIMTSPDHPSGSDRLAEAIAHFPQATHIVNIQGDEPFIDPALIDELAASLVADPSLSMATAACPLEDEADLNNPNVVKCVTDLQGNALYFSRSLLPFPRNPFQKLPLRHLGIYAYRRDFLEQFVRWQPTPLELTESLEQLRALEHGAKIRVLTTTHQGLGVDTPEQAIEAEAIIARRLSEQASKS